MSDKRLGQWFKLKVKMNIWLELQGSFFSALMSSNCCRRMARRVKIMALNAKARAASFRRRV
jgi:hypothetical protein